MGELVRFFIRVLALEAGPPSTVIASMDGQSRSSKRYNSELSYLFSKCLFQQFSATALP